MIQHVYPSGKAQKHMANMCKTLIYYDKLCNNNKKKENAHCALGEDIILHSCILFDYIFLSKLKIL